MAVSKICRQPGHQRIVGRIAIYLRKALLHVRPRKAKTIQEGGIMQRGVCAGVISLDQLQSRSRITFCQKAPWIARFLCLRRWSPACSHANKNTGKQNTQSHHYVPTFENY